MEQNDPRVPLIAADADILESQISALVEAFEQKHKPIQVTIRTRWPNPKGVYQLEKGGAAQVSLVDTHNEGDGIMTPTVCAFMDDANKIMVDITVAK